MTLEQFNLADELVQAKAICKGVCVAGRDEGIHKVLLYQVEKFYVEIYYHPRRQLITSYKAITEDEIGLYFEKSEMPMAVLNNE